MAFCFCFCFSAIKDAAFWQYSKATLTAYNSYGFACLDHSKITEKSAKSASTKDIKLLCKSTCYAVTNLEYLLPYSFSKPEQLLILPAT